LKVKELPAEDRPREKLILHGPQSLSDAELLAILLRTGTKGKSVITIAQEIISSENNLAFLASKTIAYLTKKKGVGKNKAATLAAAFEIARRILAQQKKLSNKKITSPQDVAEEFIPLLRDELKEQFIVLCLNKANYIIRKEVITVGILDSSIVHPREVFKVAVENNAASIILIHNHPSGNPEPSSEDISITKKLVEAGKMMEIPVYDHIIIAGNNYTSFVDRRII
jgi:DNA repair protein RadC